MTERTRIALLRARLERDASGVRVGIGDDAAVLAPFAGEGESVVWTVDAQVEGTHFRVDLVSWEDVGWRSFMAAASDLAAMAAEPVAALSALALSPSVDDAALEAIARGQAAASLAVGAPIVGGNLARAAETSITTTLLGRAARPVLRTGARPGDAVWLAGPVGLAAAGLALLEGDMASRSSSANMQNAQIATSIAACVEAWQRPTARIAEGRILASDASAAIDVSDGLALDAWQLAEASGVRIVLDAQAILAGAGEALLDAAALLGRDAIELALHGGEDYALLATSRAPLRGFTRIGNVEPWAIDPAGSRVSLLTPAGMQVLEPRGFDHFPG